MSLFAGQSGVGKSSLLNALIPDLDAQTGALSRVTAKGTHTTTTATAHHYGDSAWLIDTPGVWEYGLWKMEANTLQRGFPEFSEHAARCKFRDCRHRSEPGCAVIAAVESGALPAFRHTPGCACWPSRRDTDSSGGSESSSGLSQRRKGAKFEPLRAK